MLSQCFVGPVPHVHVHDSLELTHSVIPNMVTPFSNRKSKVAIDGIAILRNRRRIYKNDLSRRFQLGVFGRNGRWDVGAKIMGASPKNK